MLTTSLMIAKLIVQVSPKPISNLKLQKLLYYVQGWHLGLHEAPAFTGDIQAWIHGPVVPLAFHHYREFRWTPIVVDSQPTGVREVMEQHVRAVLAAYGGLTATQLEALSHMEDPWKQARKGLAPDAPSKNVISHESMRHYFRKLANG